MITIDTAPRWIRELARFIPLKNSLFLHGNVLDLVSYPVKPGERDAYWVSGTIKDFLQRYLAELDYEVIGLCDTIDGLRFAEPEMESTYRAIAAGKKPASGKKEGYSRQDDHWPKGPSEGGEYSSARGGRPLSDRDSCLEREIPGIRRALANTDIPCVFIIEFASRLVSNPGNLVSNELKLCTQLLKGSLEGSDVNVGNLRRKNLIIFTCEKLNDIPTFLYMNNPRARSIAIEKPDTPSRTRILESNYRSFYSSNEGQPSAELASRFAALTEGLSHYEIMSLIDLSRGEEIPVSDTRGLLERYKFGIRESEWDKIDRSRLAQAENIIGGRILGQGLAVARVLDIVKRARGGTHAGTANPPRGVLFFSGPTGVGKTELAKGLSQLLFGQEDRLIRFDMSEYKGPHSHQKLIGSPPGYVGYDEGGQLTNAVKAQPFSVLLFDEIEKADPGIWEIFLQILDDGRLTDSKGETVYFSECLIIFTSNLGAKYVNAQGVRAALQPEDMNYRDLRTHFLQAIRDHFNLELSLPEMLNRFGDNIVAFDFIRPPVNIAIVNLLIRQLKQSYKEQRRILLEVDDGVLQVLAELSQEQLHHGGRGIRNTVDAALVNPLARWLFDHEVLNDAQLTIHALRDNGEDAAYRFELEVREES